MSDEIQVIDNRKREMASIATPTPATLLQIAVSQGADIAKLEKLMELQERWEANEARKAYALAMAAFKAENLTIRKNKRVHFTSSKGTTDYKHATLDNVVAVVAAGLAKHGLMHTWRTEQANGKIRVTCIITHEKGHAEETSLECAADESGNKNSIQAIGSAVSYLQRYTLLAATGTATGEDDDGRAAGKPVQTTKLASADDIAQIRDLIKNIGGDERKTCGFFHIAKLEDLPADKVSRVIAALQAKIPAKPVEQDAFITELGEPDEPGTRG